MRSYNVCMKKKAHTKKPIKTIKRTPLKQNKTALTIKEKQKHIHPRTHILAFISRNNHALCNILNKITFL